MILLTWTFSFQVFKRSSFQIWVLLLLILSIKKVLGKFGKNLKNDPLDLKVSILSISNVLNSYMAFNFAYFVCFFFNLEKMSCGKNLSKKQEWSLPLENFQVKRWNFESVFFLFYCSRHVFAFQSHIYFNAIYLLVMWSLKCLGYIDWDFQFLSSKLGVLW